MRSASGGFEELSCRRRAPTADSRIPASARPQLPDLTAVVTHVEASAADTECVDGPVADLAGRSTPDARDRTASFKNTARRRGLPGSLDELGSRDPAACR